MNQYEGPTIDVVCSEGFVPPSGLSRSIARALSWIEPVDLTGLKSILLFEQLPFTTPGKNLDLDNAIRNGLLLFAAYNSRSASEPPHIFLIMSNLYKPIPGFLCHSSAFTLWIAENIAHEVGHHLIAEKRFTLQPKADGSGLENEEEFADRYASSVIARMKSSRRYMFGSFLLAVAAELNYGKGVRSWKKGKYQIAADFFYLATQLRRDHAEAGFWFWKAKERASQGTAAT